MNRAMAKIKIDGTDGAYDGVWDFDGNLTNGEYHRLFLLTGVQGADMADALDKGNVGVYCALAVVALERHGKYVDFQILLDSTSIPTLDADPPEDDADAPLDGPSVPGPSSGSGAKKTSSARGSKSGSAS